MHSRTLAALLLLICCTSSALAATKVWYGNGYRRVSEHWIACARHLLHSMSSSRPPAMHMCPPPPNIAIRAHSAHGANSCSLYKCCRVPASAQDLPMSP